MINHNIQGWVPDLPDLRDYTTDKLNLKLSALPTIPKAMDLTKFCSPIEDQGSLGSCTANAAAGIFEYYQRRDHNKHVDLSRLFLYKVTRKQLGWTGDEGAYLRTTMGSLVLFGAPPEQYYPYDVAKFDKEPDSFAYAYAANYKASQYYRVDTQGIYGMKLLDKIKLILSIGMPLMFGFTVYSSISQTNAKGLIPYPSSTDRVEGGHAIGCYGYDDSINALLIRNSWGTSWGNKGYGWLPYNYVINDLAMDWWGMYKASYVDNTPFINGE